MSSNFRRSLSYSGLNLAHSDERFGCDNQTWNRNEEIASPRPGGMNETSESCDKYTTAVAPCSSGTAHQSQSLEDSSLSEAKYRKHFLDMSNDECQLETESATESAADIDPYITSSALSDSEPVSVNSDKKCLSKGQLLFKIPLKLVRKHESAEQECEERETTEESERLNGKEDIDVNSILRDLDPINRKKLFIKQLRSRWYLIVVPLLVAIALLIIVGAFLLPLFSERTMIEVFVPPEPISAIWKVKTFKDQSLVELATSGNINEVRSRATHLLVPHMMQAYAVTQYPITSIDMVNVSVETFKEKTSRTPSINSGKMVSLEHVLVFNKNTSLYDDVKVDINNLVRMLRQYMVESKIWSISIGDITLRQGKKTVRSASLKRFLEQPIPPTDLSSVSLFGGMKKRTSDGPHEDDQRDCGSIFIPAHTTVRPHNCTLLSVRYPPGSQCTFSCHPDYKLSGHAVRVCLPTGVWDGHGIQCIKPCKPLANLRNGQFIPKECSENETITESTRCIAFCDKLYALTSHTSPVCLDNGEWSAQPPLCKRQCPPLQVPRYLQVMPSSCVTSWSHEGRVCVFACTDEMGLEGEMSVSCDSDGRWTEDIPVCRRLCKKLEPVSNSVVLPVGCNQGLLFAGMSCTYACPDEFQLTGKATRTCELNGRWSDTPPRCIRTCDVLNTTEGGLVSPIDCLSSRSLAGSSCNFSCEAGYKIVGEPYAICLKTGRWNNRVPRCFAECPLLGTPQHGTLSCTSSEGKTFCALLCKENYKLLGSPVVACQSDGTWSRPLGICIVTCPRLTKPKNSEVFPTECTESRIRLGVTCLFTCQLSYAFSGSTMRTCSANGTWSGLPFTCNWQKQQYMLILHHTPFSVCLSADETGIVPIKVNFDECSRDRRSLWSIYQGRSLKNSKNNMCIGFSSLENMAPLEFVPCNPFDSRQAWEWPSKAQLSYTIKIGFKDLYMWFGYPTTREVFLTEENTALTKWLFFDMRTERLVSFHGASNGGKCPLLPYSANGKWSPASCSYQEKDSGTRCVFTCNHGFDLTSGKGIVSCITGIWYGNISPTCDPTCSSVLFSKLKSGTVSPPSCVFSSHNALGSTCSFDCNLGFVLRGEKNIACLANGQWTAEQPVCKLLCPPLMVPRHASLVISSACPSPEAMSEPGTVCMLNCDEGYGLEGPASSRCLENGTWSEIKLFCTRSCSPPDRPILGTIVCDRGPLSFPVGAVCKYACPGTLSLWPLDSGETHCSSGGMWNSSVPTCQNLCPPLTVSPNSVISPSECLGPEYLPNGKICFFSCESDFKLAVNNRTECLPNGFWSESSVACTPSQHFTMKQHSDYNDWCVAVEYYPYHDLYSVVKRLPDLCPPADPTSQWQRTSVGQLRHVETGRCLGVDNAAEDEVLRLFACNNSNVNQKWTCEITENVQKLQLRNTEFAVHIEKDPSLVVLIRKFLLTSNTSDYSWIATDNKGQNGSVCGMGVGIPTFCPRIDFTAGTIAIPTKQCNSEVSVGSICSIMCDHGYELSSGAMTVDLRCLENGVWNTKDVFCKRRKCKQLPLSANQLVSNASCATSSVPAWSSILCEVTCRSGLQRRIEAGDTGFLRCFGNGAWSEPVPKCLRICKALSHPRHGSVEPIQECTVPGAAVEGNTCEFKCKPHYKLVGYSRLQCTDGSWNGIVPTCQKLKGPKICFPQTPPDYGHVSPPQCLISSIPFNTSCSVTCVSGYTPVSLQTGPSYCQANGKWSSLLPQCKRICPALSEQEHGAFSPMRCTQDINPVGSECTLHCHIGYSVAASRIVNCVDDGTWDIPIPNCMRKEQFLLQMASMALCLSTTNDSASGKVAFKPCFFYDPLQRWEWIDGEKLRNLGSHSCLKPRSNLSYSRIVVRPCAMVSHRWKCNYFANTIYDNFAYNGLRLAYAKSKPYRSFAVDINSEESHWKTHRSTTFVGVNESSHGTPCSFRSQAICAELPEIPDGFIQVGCGANGKSIIAGKRCQYFCKSGYQLIGTSARVCQDNGLWDDATPVTCQRLCPALSVPPLSYIEPSACTVGASFQGTLCHYSCYPDYVLAGPRERVCGTSGAWSEYPPFCHRSCSALAINFGVFASPSTCLQSPVKTGTSCVFSCFNGYRLQGSPFRTCLKDGTWTGTSPVCGRACKPLSPVAHGRVFPLDCFGSGRQAGDSCVFLCDTLYILQGNRVRSCTDNGLWTYEQPKCLRICRSLLHPTNGMLHCDKNVNLEGDKCVYKCLPDYVIEGENSVRRCLRTGLWSGSAPRCTREFQFMVLQDSPPIITKCLYKTAGNDVNMRDTRSGCRFDDDSARWAWYQKRLIRNVASRLCLAGQLLPSRTHLVLTRCDLSDPRQRWECSDPQRPRFIRLSSSKLYPLDIPFSTNKVLLFSGPDLDYIIRKGLGVTKHTHFYAKTATLNRLSICAAKRESYCLPLSKQSHLVITPSLCTMQEAKENTQCSFSCNSSKYDLSVPVTSTVCLKTGLWSHESPQCVPACRPFHLPRGSSVYVTPPSCWGRKVLLEGFACKFNCPSNYRLIGRTILTCTQMSEWNAERPQCMNTCPPLTELKGVVITPAECSNARSRVLEGTKCSYLCLQKQHVLIGGEHRVCANTGLWTGREPICVKPCPALVPPVGGKIMPRSCFKSESLAKAVCSISCGVSLTQFGSNKRICRNNGSWSGFTAVCRTPCPVLKIPGNNYSLSPPSCSFAITQPGHSCEVVCRGDLFLIGEKFSTCLETGIWSTKLGSCVRRCPKLSQPANGQIAPSFCLGGSLYAGHECTYRCQVGYLLTGSSVRLCSSNGSWTGNDPTCERVCDPLDKAANVLFNPKECSIEPQIVGTVCRLSCSKGTSARSGTVSSDLVCRKNGKWSSDTVESCYETCPIPHITQGRTSCMAPSGRSTTIYVVGTRCKAVCDDDYISSSFPTSSCESRLNKAVWNPTITSCIYDPDPMVIVSRIGFRAVCFADKDSKVVQVEWQQCAKESLHTQWSWHGEHLIRNAATGRCMAASKPEPNVLLGTAPCNDTDPLQEWDCEESVPFCMRMLRYDLTIDTSRQRFDVVLLQGEMTQSSLVYTYNPNTESQTGTLCSKRKPPMCPPLRLSTSTGTLILTPKCGSNPSPVNTLCLVRCAYAGHTAISVVCRPSGFWEPELRLICPPACEPPPRLIGKAYYITVGCQQIHPPMNTTCSVACPPGHVLSGKETETTCSKNYQWTPLSDYKCVRACPPIEDIDNGHVTPKPCVIGSCSLHCNPGYKANGHYAILCLSDGRWSAEHFVCAPDLQFTIMSDKSLEERASCLTVTSTEAVVKLPCLVGNIIQMWKWHSHHTLVNIANSMCLAYNETVGLNTTLLNRTLSQPSSPFDSSKNSNAIFSVQHHPRSDNTLITAKCNQADAKQRWDCSSEPGSLSRLRVRLIKYDLLLDSGPVFRTKLGLKTMGHRSLLWYGGHYSGKGSVCAFRNKGVCPPLPKPYGGTFSPGACLTQYITPGTRCHLSCDEGYILSGDSTVVCKRNGFWLKRIANCIGMQYCPPLKTTKHLHALPRSCTTNRVPEGRVCHIECRDNTVLVGTQQLLCRGDMWSENMPVCEAVCPALYPTRNGRVFPELCEHDDLPALTVCFSVCDDGYKPLGDSSSTCLEDGVWSGLPLRCEKFCPALEKLTHGRIVPDTCETDAGSNAFACNPECSLGFFLLGASRLVCNHGNWSDVLPICSDDWCAKLDDNSQSVEEISYSNLKNGAVAPQTVATIYCRPGFIVDGQANRMCLDSGRWFDGNKTCQLKKCPAITRLYHGSVKPAKCGEGDASPSEVCHFECEKGYALTGPSYVECQSGGKWSSDTVAQCYDAAPRAYLIDFAIVFQQFDLNERRHSLMCLVSARNSKEATLEECHDDGHFELWHWYGGARLQNSANGLCVAMNYGHKLILDTCDLNNTRQLVECGDVDSPLGRHRIKVGGYYVGRELTGSKHAANVQGFAWSAVKGNYLEANARASQINAGGATACSFMCGGTLTGGEGDFSSPNYPHLYPADVFCTWIIRTKQPKSALLLDFSDVSLKHSEATTYQSHFSFGNNEFLTIAEAEDPLASVLVKITKSASRFRVTSLHGMLKVQFQSSHHRNRNGTGFSAHWSTCPWHAPKPDCGDPDDKRPVQSGTGRAPARAPWQTMVLLKQLHACNAFVIARRAVISTAHCISNFAPYESLRLSDYRVVQGFESQEELMRQKERDLFVKVTALYLHPNFSRETLEWDVAVIIAKNSLTTVDSFQPICVQEIATGPIATGATSNCWAVQWLESMLFTVSAATSWEWTRYRAVDLMWNTECGQHLQRNQYASDSHFLCATEAEIKTATDIEYDFSQPLVTEPLKEGLMLQCRWNDNWYVVGALTVTLKKEKTVYVFTNLIRHSSWITEKLKKNYLK